MLLIPEHSVTLPDQRKKYFLMSDQKKNYHYGNEKRTSFPLKFLSLYLSSLISVSLSLKSSNVFELYDFILSKYDEENGEKHIFWNHYDLPRKRGKSKVRCLFENGVYCKFHVECGAYSRIQGKRLIAW